MVSDLHKAELQGRKIQLGRQPQGVLGVAVPRGSTSLEREGLKARLCC